MSAQKVKNSNKVLDVLQQLAKKLTDREDFVGKQLVCEQESVDIGRQIECLLMDNKNSYGKFYLRAEALARKNLNSISVTSPSMYRCQRLLKEYEELNNKLCEMAEPVEKRQLTECLMFITYDLMPLVQRISARHEEETGQPCPSLDGLTKLKEMVEQRKFEIDTNSCEASPQREQRRNQLKSMAVVKFKYALIGAICGSIGAAWSQAEHHSPVQEHKNATEIRHSM